MLLELTSGHLLFTILAMDIDELAMIGQVVDEFLPLERSDWVTLAFESLPRGAHVVHVVDVLIVLKFFRFWTYSRV